MPPTATASAARRSTPSVSSATGDWRNCALTRSYEPSGKVSPSTCRSQVIRSATPASVAWVAARSRATWAMSMPVTCQPRLASQTASAPSPQPRSSAVPGERSDASRTSSGLGFPLQIRSLSR
ncbi:UNVERIFIED_CONTAM: hypothetical protein LK11_18135 [Mumia flava]